MSRGPTGRGPHSVVSQINRLAADRDAKNALIPPDMAKVAFWRKGQQHPITFVVTDSEGQALVARYRGMVQGGVEGVLEFETYSDGSGRKSMSVLDVEDITGVTFEFATVSLASAGG